MSKVKRTVYWVGMSSISILIFVAFIVWLSFLLTGNLVDTVQNQLTALRDGDFTKAYSYTSNEFKKTTSFDEFTKFVNGFPSLRNNVSISFSNREINHNEGMVRGTLRSKDGDIIPVEYHLVKEDNKWKILSMQIDPLEEKPTYQTTAEVKGPEQEAAALTQPHAQPEAQKVPPTEANNGLTNLYQNQNNHYTVNYPADWTYEQSGNSSIVFSGKKGTPAYQATVNIQTVLPKKMGGRYRSAKALVRVLKKETLTQSKQVEFLDEGDVDFSDPNSSLHMNGYYVVLSYTLQGQKFKQMQFIFTRADGKAFYTWAYTSPEDSFETYFPVAKSMFATWTIR